MTKNKKAAIAAVVVAPLIWMLAVHGDYAPGEARRYSAPGVADPLARDHAARGEGARSIADEYWGNLASAKAMSADLVQMACDTIELEIDVLDASISQEGEKLALAIIVLDGTSEARAKQLGENFVRLAKTFGPDDNPSQEIGRGRYDYLVGIKTIGGKTIAMGAKVDMSPRITW